MRLRWFPWLAGLGVLSAAAVVAASSSISSGDNAPTGRRRALEYAPAPVDNPLKGLVPYSGDVRDRFPHSLEFNYLPLSALVTGYDRYDWAPLEKLLDEVAGRGHQAVFRIFLEYPGKTGAIPAFLVEDGLKVHKYLNTNTQPLPPAPIETPDYEDPKLRRVLKAFIAALGKKYDGDPRIGFLTAGLLGTWGEWHTYPRDELFASKAVQAEVMDAYEAAFRVTPVLMRYPAGPADPQKAPNARRRFGYHDDSFAWATLDTGRPEDAWFFVPVLKAAGAVDKWKTRPIGGEIRPEAWGEVFDEKPGNPQIQDFRRCVEETHASWLMDSGMFREKQPPARVRRAEQEVRRMGYEFHVAAVTVGRVAAGGGVLPVRVELENRGVAPFYYDWPVEFGLLGAGGRIVKTFRGTGKLTGLLPAGGAGHRRVWDERLAVRGVPRGAYRLAVRAPNPLRGGHPLRFANKTQDADAPGWLTLGEIALR